jgi:hypothetical protein
MATLKRSNTRKTDSHSLGKSLRKYANFKRLQKSMQEKKFKETQSRFFYFKTPNRRNVSFDFFSSSFWAQIKNVM